MKRWIEKPWFNHAIVACIAVVLYVVLTHFSSLWRAVSTFFGYFTPVILGCVIAYIINPLSKLYYRSVFKRIKKEKRRMVLSNILAFFTVILILVLLVLLLIPQLIESIRTFVMNLEDYVASFSALLEKIGLSASMLDLDSFVDSSESILNTVIDFVKKNLNTILSTSVDAGRGIAQALIAFLLSAYLLSEKRKVKAGAKRLLRALVGEDRYVRIRGFLKRSHDILTLYIAWNLLDSLIIGAANAIFMAILGMPYVGIVSFVVAVANLVPTFGPIIGAVIGGFVLVLVNPWNALEFLLFTIVLQILDAYLIKPKMFGNSLGISGLWILIGVIVGGRMFGMIGILLAIPGVAILDMLYRDYFLPWLESRRGEKKKE